jgi:hypothetical protein
VRVPEGEGWFCETRCAVEHLLEHAGLDMQVEWVQIDPDTGRPLSPSSTEKRDSGSPTATPAPESSRPESAQADFASTDRDFNPGVNPAPNPGGPPAPRPAVQQTEDGVKVVLPGGLVIMTRRRPT